MTDHTDHVGESLPGTTSPPGELRTIESADCYALLATQDLGRLGIVAEHYPLILPVNYAMDGSVIVFRTAPGTVLASADGANVTFQVDDIDRVTRSGWSVLVRGQAELVTTQHGGDIVAHTAETGAVPWAPGDRPDWLRLIPHRISGRRIVPATLAAWQEPSGYL